MLSLYLGWHRIYAAAVERDTVSKQFVIEAPHVEKGKISDLPETARAISEALQAQKLKVRRCVFTLPSSAVVTREMQPPKLSRKDMLSFVRTGFSAILELTDDHAVDYLLPPGKEAHAILGFCFRKSLVEQCAAVAKLAGLSCRRVDLQAAALQRYIAKNELECPSAYMAVHVDGQTATVSLMEEGRLFVRVSQLDGQTGQESDKLLQDWAMSFNTTLIAAQEQTSRTRALTEQIQSIVQFQVSRNGQNPVGKVYLYGDVDRMTLVEIRASVAPQVQMLCEEDGQLPYLDAVGAGLAGKQDVNLMECLKRRTSAQLRERRGLLLFLAILLLAGAAGMEAGVLLRLENRLTEQKIELTENYLYAADTVEKLARARQLDRLLREQRVYNAALESFNRYFSEQYRFHSGSVSGIYAQAEQYAITVEYCEYSAGVLNMTCYASDSTVAAEFARALEREGIAENVAFEGYSRLYGAHTTDYMFQLSGTIQGGGAE